MRAETNLYCLLCRWSKRVLTYVDVTATIIEKVNAKSKGVRLLLILTIRLRPLIQTALDNGRLNDINGRLYLIVL